MRSPLTRPEAALAGVVSLVLVAASASALALGDDDGDGPVAAAPATRTAVADPTAPVSASPSSEPSATPSALSQTSPPAVPLPQDSPVGDVAPPPPGPAPAPPPAQRPPEQVALAFFEAAVQGRDDDALVVAEAQALSDLREYEAWQSHRLGSCAPEQSEVVCVFEAESTFLRLALVPNPDTGWRVLSVS